MYSFNQNKTIYTNHKLLSILMTIKKFWKDKINNYKIKLIYLFKLRNGFIQKVKKIKCSKMKMKCFFKNYPKRIDIVFPVSGWIASPRHGQFSKYRECSPHLQILPLPMFWDFHWRIYSAYVQFERDVIIFYQSFLWGKSNKS